MIDCLPLIGIILIILSSLTSLTINTLVIYVMRRSDALKNLTILVVIQFVIFVQLLERIIYLTCQIPLEIFQRKLYDARWSLGRRLGRKILGKFHESIRH